MVTLNLDDRELMVRLLEATSDYNRYEGQTAADLLLGVDENDLAFVAHMARVSMLYLIEALEALSGVVDMGMPEDVALN